jgi:hypothetical protein
MTDCQLTGAGLTDPLPTGRLTYVTGRNAATFAAAAAMLLVPAAAQAKRGSIYDVTKASGFERLTFSGDADSNCAQFSVCGYSGVTNYKIGGTTKGTLVLTRTKKGKVSARATYKAGGTTTATVTPPAPGVDCTDTVSQPRDVFSLTSSGSSFKSLLLAYHAQATHDYLKTQCIGPSEKDVAAANALPQGIFTAKDFFRGATPRPNLSGGTPFQAKGFNATVEWDLKFRLKARACSPDCKLPAG